MARRQHREIFDVGYFIKLRLVNERTKAWDGVNNFLCVPFIELIPTPLVFPEIVDELSLISVYIMQDKPCDSQLPVTFNDF